MIYAQTRILPNIIWVFEIKIDHLIQLRKQFLVFINKKKVFAILWCLLFRQTKVKRKRKD